jgi:hypothetical protein
MIADVVSNHPNGCSSSIFTQMKRNRGKSRRGMSVLPQVFYQIRLNSRKTQLMLVAAAGQKHELGSSTGFDITPSLPEGAGITGAPDKMRWCRFVWPRQTEQETLEHQYLAV